MRNFQRPAQLRSYVNLIGRSDDGRMFGLGHIFKNGVAEKIYVHFNLSKMEITMLSSCKTRAVKDAGHQPDFVLFPIVSSWYCERYS